MNQLKCNSTSKAWHGLRPLVSLLMLFFFRNSRVYTRAAPARSTRGRAILQQSNRANSPWLKRIPHLTSTVAPAVHVAKEGPFISTCVHSAGRENQGAHARVPGMRAEYTCS